MATPNELEDRTLWSEKAPYWDLHIGDDGDRNRRRHVDPVMWRMLGAVAGRDVLDAGCGTGYLSAKLARRGARVTAIDYAPGMVERAQARMARLAIAVEPRVDDCCRLETVADASQDLLVSNYVLQDLEDLTAAVGAFARVLRPGAGRRWCSGTPASGTRAGPSATARRCATPGRSPTSSTAAARRCGEGRTTRPASGSTSPPGSPSTTAP